MPPIRGTGVDAQQILTGLILAGTLWIAKGVHEVKVDMASVKAATAEFPEVKRQVFANTNEIGQIRQQQGQNMRDIGEIKHRLVVIGVAGGIPK